MKKILCAFLALFSFAFGDDDPSYSPDYTPMFSIRSLENGITLSAKRDNTMQQNWYLREVILNDTLKQKDKIGQKLPFGHVQFVSAADANNCLAIGADGFFTTKQCERDIRSGQLESVFSIIPSKNTGVQIRSLVLEGDECISTFYNPNVPIERSFGLQDCAIHKGFILPLKNLFVFAPPLTEATPLFE